MILLLSSAMAAILVGIVIGGRVRNLERLRPRWWGLAFFGLAAQFPLPIRGHTGDVVNFTMLMLSYAALIAFAAVNVRIAGAPLILAGLLLNFVVISLNGGMPVTEHAMRASGQAEFLPELRRGAAAKHHLATGDDVLLFLGDVIPIPAPIHQVVSVGDIAVYAGVIWVVASSMRGPRRKHERRRGSASNRTSAPVGAP